MLTVETIRKIRLAVHRDGKSIRKTAKDLNLSRNTVRKVIRSDQTAFEYKRRLQPHPRLGDYINLLEERLSKDQKLPKKQRRTAQMLYEGLQLAGYEGGYDAVRRHVKRWRQDNGHTRGQVFIPLVFEPGEAFQFDWSHESVQMDGLPVKVKVAHIRLCHSRLFLTVAYPRETQEMVFDAHMRAFEFFGGVCCRGIYDNLKTVVNKILAGKERNYNSRFAQLSSHYLFEPVACTPASGWEKGQVENQVGVVRRRFFTPRLKVKDFKELNTYLLERCLTWAKTRKHPTLPDQTVWDVYEAERPYLMKLPPRFDGYAERPARVSPSSLVTFDRNRYSVNCREVGRVVQFRVYADRIVIVSDNEIVGDHPRQFGRNKTVFDPWHYLPVLDRKPGALRNGAPFKGWDLPVAIKRVQDRLQRLYADWDHQFVSILKTVPICGLEAVDGACRQALKLPVVSKEVVLNILHRGQDKEPGTVIDLPERLILKNEPVADCQRYELLVQQGQHAAK
ncbi:MAG: IS21 family transposase [Desulfobacteraceae bacterium]|nr:IS21 family transposase [Desulfobacteraceae bacterium]